MTMKFTEIEPPEQSVNGSAPDDSDGLDGLVGKRKESAATKIVGLVEQEAIELFCDDEMTPFATFEVNGTKQTWPIRSREFGNFTSRLHYDARGLRPAGRR